MYSHIPDQSPPPAGRRRAGLIVGLLLASAAIVIALDSAPPAAAKMKRAISVYPSPGTPVASDRTTFSFRGIKKKNLGPVTVTGRQTGRHRGRLLAHSDGRGVSFIPRRKFRSGELVTVRTKRLIRGAKGGRNGRFWVRIGRFYGNEPGDPDPIDPTPGTLKSRPALKPPVISVKTFTPDASMGKLTFAPKSEGLTIADRKGRITWFRPAWAGGAGTSVTNLQVGRYRGEPVLTYFKNSSATGGMSQQGYYEILNRNYKRIARFGPGNGYGPDLHEFILTPRDTALAIAYRGVKWNAKKFGGSRDSRIMDNVIQELDVKTGAVLFEWHSIGNVGIGESQQVLPDDGGTFDYFHLNSVEWDGPNALLISARKTSSLYRINRWNGKLMWILRGAPHRARNSFRMGPGTAFAYQHDARRMPNGDISLFDNGSAFGNTVNAASAGMVLRLRGKSKADRTATLMRRDEHPDGIAAGPEGSTQILPDGNQFVGWGGVSRMSEFDGEGNLTFDATFHGADLEWSPDSNFRVSSYRSFKFPWHGIAPGRPAIASEVAPESEPEGLTVWVSWNGASNIRSWRVLTGADEAGLSEAATVPWTGLETEIEVPGAVAGKVQVEALDGKGQVLGSTAVADAGTRVR